jgi:copper(I)-binding protein
MRIKFAAVIVGLLLMSACGPPSAADELAAQGAWARPTPAGATNGVVYLSVTSDVDDEIIGAVVPPTIALRAELHETMTDAGAGGHHGGGDGATMSMGEVERVSIGAGSTVEFEPGGNHVMLVGIAEPLERGETFTLQLMMSSGRTIETDVAVADNPPG